MSEQEQTKASKQDAAKVKQDKGRRPRKKGTKLTKRELKVQRHKKKLREKRERRTKIAAARAKSSCKFQIRCRKPVEDEIFDVDEFVKYLQERFKVDGKTGQVGPARPVNIQKSVTTVHVTSKKPFPKFYVKFLTKRYLKRHGLRDYVRVIADKKASYELRYFNIQDDKQQ
eukprot:CAMPEP_0202687716 /NCGR_PEP_ID=MMETSP1385-20130828/3364_1 /ASSEMBLY_ACC=CAM_ASM_000861 /TAXON_ID=933848 /ORGANISM="Elphidium margaritaceum" /LENGTH=170 /DNA_ID=CAMNT_0049342555 /DNA_START=81 /DNA_END=593 /DNA_ORIENTATION=-